MTPDTLTPQQRVVLAHTPHVHQLLDALNPHGALRVHDLNLDQSSPHVLEVECRVSGLDPAEAISWAEANSNGPMLRVHAPTIRTRACTLWFGKVRFQHLPDAYLRLEVPLATLAQPMEHESFLVLTSHADVKTLDEWAANERERLAENGVERYLRPILLQSEAFGFEAVALGLREALLRLAPEKAAGLLGCTTPVLMTAWIHAWTQALALRAPRLRGVAAELMYEHTEATVRAQIDQSDVYHAQPSVSRIRLTATSGESRWVRAEMSETDFDEAPEELDGLRALTGATLSDSQQAVSLLQDLAALLLTNFRALGTTLLEWPAGTTPGSASADQSSHSD